jgi:ribonuclease HII
MEPEQTTMESEQPSMESEQPSMESEQINVVIGVDEAGRGCAWGSVFAGAVVLPERLRNEDTMSTQEKNLLRDSKKLSHKKRETARQFVIENAISYAIGESTSDEIDRVNILNATFTAMHRAIKKCIQNLPSQYKVSELLIDGNRFRLYLDEDDIPMNHQCIIGGDAIDRSIAAASILAKTEKDIFVSEHVKQDPSLNEKWGMSSHKGYCTKQHRDALLKYGIHELHRKSYAPVKVAMRLWSTQSHETMMDNEI